MGFTNKEEEIRGKSEMKPEMISLTYLLNKNIFKSF
jgi:hypothetical protein